MVGVNTNNWQRRPINPCACGCGHLVAKRFKKGHGRRRPLLERLLEKVQVNESGCWLWGGALDAGGYGRIGTGGHSTDMAHRVAYELLVGPIPHGLHIDHLCVVRRCVNPDHLEPVTQAENNARAASRRGNDDALIGAVIVKRRATTDPGDQVVVMTVRDLVALLTGTRP